MESPAIHERDAQSSDDEQILIVADPEKRTAVDQQVPERSPAQGRHDREAVRSDDVHAFSSRGDHSRHCRKDYGRGFERGRQSGGVRSPTTDYRRCGGDLRHRCRDDRVAVRTDRRRHRTGRARRGDDRIPVRPDARRHARRRQGPRRVVAAPVVVVGVAVVARVDVRVGVGRRRGRRHLVVRSMKRGPDVDGLAGSQFLRRGGLGFERRDFLDLGRREAQEDSIGIPVENERPTLPHGRIERVNLRTSAQFEGVITLHVGQGRGRCEETREKPHRRASGHPLPPPHDSFTPVLGYRTAMV